ncbi:hypothetical protein [Shimazuella kribbensis]|uniref:hypothetical protein n=1 Tax=Shimazuella kribbensis TaxID=139808 RepID=UPI0012EC4C28|nr:hypothetical protein [Shimazuella kribbensis]
MAKTIAVPKGVDTSVLIIPEDSRLLPGEDSDGIRVIVFKYGGGVYLPFTNIEVMWREKRHMRIPRESVRDVRHVYRGGELKVEIEFLETSNNDQPAKE